MPWLPPGTPHNLIARTKASEWYDFADGKPVGAAPHTLRPQVYGCRINRDFPDLKAKPPIQYKKGMQGQLLGEKTDKEGVLLARVYIQGVTEGQGFTNRWMPRACIDKGQPWKENLAEWAIRGRIATPTFNTAGWTAASTPQNTVLGRTIMRALVGMMHSTSDFPNERLEDFFNKQSVASFCQEVLKGIQDAGLLEFLTANPGNFTADQLVNAAKIQIKNKNDSHKGGVYLRIHRSSQSVTFWKPNSTYGYVGKTVDFGERCVSHQHTSSSYGDLNRNSSSWTMIAICVLPSFASQEKYFIIEQLMVLLFGTYRVELTESDLSSGYQIQFGQPAKFFTSMFEEVCKTTQWTPILQRSSFGIKYGANCSSPVLEIGTRFDKILLIRTDANVKDAKTGRIVPLAAFRSSKQFAYAGGKTEVKDWLNVNVFDKRTLNPARTVIKFGYTITPNTSESELPLPGTPYQVVFEVHKDGTPHPHSWARLPEIGRFENWQQANSFAARIEWQSPPGSGKWRFKYLQTFRLYGSMDRNIPGALATYAKATAFLQWLTGSRVPNLQSFVPHLYGSARVLQAEYDMMEQRVIFKSQDQRIRMQSGAVRPERDIIQQMNLPNYGLGNVDGTFGVLDGKAQGRRRHCDTCALLPDKDTVTLPDKSCRQKHSGSRVCTVCEHFGRPCCSWTAKLRAVDRDVIRSPEEVQDTDKFASALVYQPIQNIDEILQGFSQFIAPLAEKDQLLDDGDEFQDDEEDSAKFPEI